MRHCHPPLNTTVFSLALALALSLMSSWAGAETPAQRADAAIDDLKTFRLLSENHAAVARIQRIFRKIERAAGVSGRFRVLVANTPEYAHAESHANGVIVITENFAAYPDEHIAFVLAHELAHEALDHPRLQALLSDELRGQESPSSFQLRVVFGLLPPEVTTRLRTDESTADTLVCGWVRRAGYAFDGLAFFQRLGREAVANPGGSATHPSYAQRIADLKQRGCAR